MTILNDAKAEATMRQISEVLAAKGKQTTPGAVCCALDRMAKQDLVTRRKSDPQPIRGGRSRYLYKLTARGRTAITELESASRALGLRARPNRGRTVRNATGPAELDNGD